MHQLFVAGLVCLRMLLPSVCLCYTSLSHHPVLITPLLTENPVLNLGAAQEEKWAGWQVFPPFP